MKHLLLILALVITNVAYSAVDSIKLSSKITDVTVFFKGAQVTHKADLKAIKGKHMLLLDMLPLDVNPQSIQVEAVNNCTIHSVKYHLVYPDQGKKSNTETGMQRRIDTLDLKCKGIRNKLSVYDVEEKLLLDNSLLQKKDNGSNISEIKEAADFYFARINEIRQSKLVLNTELEGMNKTISELYSKINGMRAKSDKAYGEIQVIVDCDKEIADILSLSYCIPSAGWTPSYDFRVSEINKPLSIVYNANVFQTSGEEWKNVNIRLSTNNPNLSGNTPDLNPWYLGRPQERQPEPLRQAITDQPNYGSESLQGDGASIKGTIMDATNNDHIPFANVILSKDGIQVGGATSDFDGNYVIRPIPAGSYTLKVAFVGYDICSINNIPVIASRITFQNVKLNPRAVKLSEVEVTDYKVPLISKDQTVSGGTVSMEDYNRGGSYSSPAPMVLEKYDYISNSLKTNVANLEYSIDIPYSIPSDGADYTIKIKEVSLSVNYVYHTVPKIDNDAFLTAEIPGWNQLNLLSGKAGIYYHGTYTGETRIDASQESDTLKVSLGRDKSILVKREGNKKLYDKHVTGNYVKETIAWDLSLKNNKDTPIHIVLQDQYPLSEKKSIEVEQLESSGAKVDDKTGKLTWEVDLEPGGKKILTFRYSVKYPRTSRLVME